MLPNTAHYSSFYSVLPKEPGLQVKQWENVESFLHYTYLCSPNKPLTFTLLQNDLEVNVYVSKTLADTSNYFPRIN